jgi:hypothetical protein
VEAAEPSTVLEWVSRETAIDVSINAVPVFILAYFTVLHGLGSPWGFRPIAVFFMYTLTLFPLVVLAVATYYVARAIERDATGA